MKLNKRIEQELDNQFPKGDEARGRALVIVAVAHLEIEKVLTKRIREKGDKLNDNKK